MRTIAVMNQKGGVGKTTTTVNLGAALAEMGKNVLLIDLDPQAHLSINFGVEPTPDLCSLYNMLVDGKSLEDALVPVNEHIGLIPSSIDLAAAEIELVNVQGREQILKQRLETFTSGDSKVQWDYVLLDCPPSLGLLTINALAVANEVLIPMQPHFLALQGVAKLLETVHLVNRRVNPSLKVSGIVLTMFDAQTKLSTEVVNELNSFILDAMGKALPWASAKVYETKIRRNIKLAEAPSFAKPIVEYDPHSNGAADYRALAREIAGLPRESPAAKSAPRAATVARTPAEPSKAPAPTKPAAAKEKRPEPAPVAAKPVESKPAAAAEKVTESPAKPKPVPAAPRQKPVEAEVPPQIAPEPVFREAPPVAPPSRTSLPHRTGTAAAAHLIAASESESDLIGEHPTPRIPPVRPVPPPRIPQPVLRNDPPSPLDVTINHTIDQSRLTASRAAKAAAPTSRPSGV